MKNLLIGLLALGSFSAFANTDCVNAVMNQISDIPQVTEAILQQDKAFSVASKHQSTSGQVEVAKEQRTFIEKIRAVAKQACPNE